MLHWNTISLAPCVHRDEILFIMRADRLKNLHDIARHLGGGGTPLFDRHGRDW